VKIWPHATIRELLALAEAEGHSRATLDSRREAERFRFAIYSFRRQNNVGNDLSITIEDTSIVITRRELPSVTIVDNRIRA
jgi:hypothetical protein